MNRYFQIVSDGARLLQCGRALPLGGMQSPPQPAPAANASRVLIFAPHPVDEGLVGGLPLRLLREGGMRVIDVVLGHGGYTECQEQNGAEHRAACNYLGFEVLTAATRDIDRLDPSNRSQEPARWSRCVAIVAEMLERTAPRLVLLPQVAEPSRIHVVTHLLVLDALTRLGGRLDCQLAETEHWLNMTAPNLLVESSIQDVADLVAATSFRAIQMKRNPYHLRLPGRLQDNVRRGVEIIGGGVDANTGFTFATLYGVRRWRNGELVRAFKGRRLLRASENAASLFP